MQNEWSSSINDRLRLKGPGDRQPVKSLLVGSRELLVDSLFNLAPLLDRALAGGLLSQENYYDVRAERTPQGRARRLLEVVHAELDEARARDFLDCLRGCQQHYPRLRAWLSADRDLQRGPAECQLQAQVSVLCARLGYSVLPLSLALFSGGTLTQFELDLVQAAPTTYQQTHQLLSVCLAKGERACCSFYQALSSEDPQLASEITGDPGVGGLAEALPAVSVVRDVPPVVPVVRDVPPVAVQETTEETDPHSGVLLQVLDQLALAPGAGGPQLNVCELGVAVGLPRRTVREGLLEEAGGGLGDVAQLRALVAMFLVKTQDAARLLTRVGECSTQRVLLSGRGRLLLKQLVEAEALLRTGAHLSGNHFREGGARDPGDRVWSIFSFLLGDIMAEVLEDCGGGERGGDPKASVRLLLGNARVEAELLRELEECWREGETESLLQSVAVLGQVLRDLHPLQDSHWLSPPAEGAVYSCRPRRLHRVTSFQGVPPRVVRKALGPGASSPSTAPLPSQYREVCLCIARLLDRVQPQGGAKDLSEATTGAIAEHIRNALCQPAFGPQAFDAGMRRRVVSVLEFDPARLELPTLLELHRDTLQGLGRYLTPGERHSFQLVPEAVRMLGSAELRWAGRVRGPVAIDNGIEEVLRFVTSDPASFLVRVVCRGYDGGRYFEAREPGCVRVSGLGEEEVEEVQAAGGIVLAVEGGAVWVREGRTELEEVSQRHSAQVHEEGCCFKVTCSGSECEVKVVCKSGKVWAVAERNCEVL